jgi:erythritol transport system ATP-binding protein
VEERRPQDIDQGDGVSSSSREVLLEARHIVKRYPGNLALDNVTFRAYRGCVNVLIGENGAGKSTLMRILSGSETPDSGEIVMHGELIRLESPRDATAQGISIVHQELAVLPNLDVSDNIFAGRELTSFRGWIDRRKEDRQATSALARLRHPLGVTTPAAQLSLGNRQILEVARALAHRSELVLLDEPSSALSLTETETLFAIIADLLANGTTVVYISHRLDELLHLGDHFTVLRSGRVVGEAVRGEATRRWFIETMSGRTSHAATPRAGQTKGPSILQVRGLSLPGVTEGEVIQQPLHEISFDVSRGEVLGIYGLLGSGRTELLESLAGARTKVSGSVHLKGASLPLQSVSQVAAAGMVLVPEDRQRDGLVPDLSVHENIALAAAGTVWLSREQEAVKVRELVRKLHINVQDIGLPVTVLSGGNQQKVLLARCLLREPAVLLLDEPTRGIDVNAKAEISVLLRELASEGLSIVFTSSEFEETKTLADRALVLCQGRIAAELTEDSIQEHKLFAAASPCIGKTVGASRGDGAR